MYKNLVTVAKVSAIALSLAVASGCATVKKEDLEAVKATAEAAKASAAQAQSTADAAMKAAEEGKTCCNQVNEKIDRMFKKSMNK